MYSELPKNIKMYEEGSSLVIEVKRKKSREIGEKMGIIIWAAIWNSFLLLWYGITITSFVSGFFSDKVIDADFMTTHTIMLVFPVLHLAVGIGVTLYVLDLIISKMTVWIDSEDITIKESINPFKKPRSYSVSSIKQLYCEEIYKKSYRTYHVNMILNNFGKILLVKDVDDKEQAQFIERKIEERLGIKDEKVDGEAYK